MDFGSRDANGQTYVNAEDPERSRWIHRDKLARIESQELQAAGIILPRARAHSKSSRRDRSRDQHTNGFGRSEESTQRRQQANVIPPEEADEQHDMGWDLRTPEEAADDRSNGYSYRDYIGQKGTSRIPLNMTSPLPIPLDYIERPTPIQRSRSNGWSGDEDGISYQKSRNNSQVFKFEEEPIKTTPTAATKRAASESSPTKKTSAPSIRKGSASAGRVASAASTVSTPGRPKTRDGIKGTPNQRPTTRSGEQTKRPEGDPPWLASMYKPDPRLPPDQQLLPTVAKRLQQEQWEKEGKFGNAYDREFRPINDEEFHQQPEIIKQQIEHPEQKPEEQGEWPLRTPKSPTLSTGRPGTAGGYSTIPKIQDVPQSPLSPKIQNATQPLRLPEPPEEETKKKGCGCCIVM
jgi:hypothetical protein